MKLSALVPAKEVGRGEEEPGGTKSPKRKANVFMKMDSALCDAPKGSLNRKPRLTLIHVAAKDDLPKKRALNASN